MKKRVSERELNNFMNYFRKALSAILFVFILPVSLFFSAIKHVFQYFGIQTFTIEVILPFIPFIAFLFTIMFLFNGAFWMGFFSEDIHEDKYSPNNSINSDW
ncbi:MAG: hypothetical protein HQK72_00860 [Desulfamplus sp.]|nr:hypothetical protein [Desulfamplus sp.]